VTDTAASLDRIRNVILPLIDKKPKQVLIETRLMEVNEDDLRDLGVDLGMGSAGNAETSTISTSAISTDQHGNTVYNLGGHALGTRFTPSVFSPKEGTATVPGIAPFSIGAQMVLQQVVGTKWEAIIHALEENVNTNTLSAPRIVTLDNQEASILVGYHTPILSSEVTSDETSGTTQTRP